MSQRLQIVLPDPVATQLQELAASGGEPTATLAAQIVRNGVALAAETGKVGASKPPASRAVGTGGRPRWLEPYGGDAAWRQETWGAIVALHGRYPRHLEHLKDDWWTDEAQTETLCALATWRAEIDDHGRDPREELAFHQHLLDYAHTLRQQGGGVSRTWQPGPPPLEWDGSVPVVAAPAYSHHVRMSKRRLLLPRTLAVDREWSRTGGASSRAQGRRRRSRALRV